MPPRTTTPSQTSLTGEKQCPLRTSFPHFALFTLLVAASIAMLVFVSGEQASLLVWKLGVNVRNNVGGISGGITAVDQVTAILLLPFWAFATQVIGGENVYAIGFVFLGGGIIAMGHAPTVAWLAVARGLFAIGGAATTAMLTLLTAQYVTERHRGKFSAVVGTTAGLGALFAAFVMLPLPQKIFQNDTVATTYTKVYTTVGCACIGVAGIVLLGLSDWKFKKSSQVEFSDTMVTRYTMRTRFQGFWQDAYKGILAVKDPRIALGYIGGFVARADSVIISVFISLWIESYFVQEGLCPQNAAGFKLKERCPAANHRYAVVTGIAQSCALAGAPIFGVIHDKFPSYVSFILAATLGVFGYCGIYFTRDPRKMSLTISAALVGLGEIGMIVSSLALVTGDFIQKEQRSWIAAGYSICGSIGLLLATQLGGLLFDSWNNRAPFFVLIIYNALALIWGAWVKWGRS